MWYRYKIYNAYMSGLLEITHAGKCVISSNSTNKSCWFYFLDILKMSKFHYMIKEFTKICNLLGNALNIKYYILFLLP
jgi:hypothetical protein